MEGDDDGPPRPDAFHHRTMGTYERRFLLNHEDLKMKFKKWTRKNFRKLSVVLAWNYLNEKLLKEVEEATLASHNITRCRKAKQRAAAHRRYTTMTSTKSGRSQAP